MLLDLHVKHAAHHRHSVTIHGCYLSAALNMTLFDNAACAHSVQPHVHYLVYIKRHWVAVACREVLALPDMRSSAM